MVSLNFWPELVGVGKYTGEMVAWLAAAGHEVHVIAAPPYYPEWRRGQGWPRFGYRRERINFSQSGFAMHGDRRSAGEIEAWRCPLYVPRHVTGATRILHLASFALSSFPLMFLESAWRPRAVIAVAPTLLSALGALCVARITGAPAWLHIQDFEVDAAFDMGLLRGGLGRRFVHAWERWLLRRFDRVSTISPIMRERLMQKGVAPERAKLFPNWVDTSSIYPRDEPTAFGSELGIDAGRMVALYSGAMAAKQGLEIVIEAARTLVAEPIDFVLCGEGPAKARLEAMAQGLVNVRFVPLQPLESLNDLLNLADIHLLPQRSDVADLVMPSKLIGMLASGRPVVATASPETQVARVVEGCGRVVAPGDVGAFAGAIVDLARDGGLRSRLGAVGRARAETEFGRTHILGAFTRELEALVEGC